MDELDEARAELRRMEGTERTLFKQLVGIRAIIKTQKSKIDELVKKRPPAISRLPVELLSQIIFQSLPTRGDYREFLELANRRTNLSTVSRLWRRVILDTPKFWSDIVVCRELPLPVASLEAQLARSGNVHLNVFIINLPYEYYQPEVRFLDVLVSSADRWRCVYIQDMVPTILRALEGLKFPSLKDVLIYNMYRVSSYPRFLLPDQAPALGSLKLDYLFPTPEFAAATTLTALELTFGGHQDQTMKPLFVLTQSLTVLSLAGDTAGWTLLPDSIHLPLLEVFKLAVDNPQPLMQAIVAPKLVYFDYSNYPSYSHTVHVSFGTGSKFSHVQRITLNFWYRVEDGDALCQEFRGAQHVSLRARALDAFFGPKDQLNDSEPVPADHWTSLESVTISGLRSCYTDDFDPLVRWLTKRMKLGRPRLSVKLSGLSAGGPMVGVDLRNIYNKLKTCSNPGVDSVELSSSVHCSTPDGLFRLDLSGVEPFVADDMILDCRIPGKCAVKRCTPLGA